MSERLLSVDAEPREGYNWLHLWIGGERATSHGVYRSQADAIAAELDRLYAAAEANQAPGPDWKAKLREEVADLLGGDNHIEFDVAVGSVLNLIHAMPDPPTPDPDAPPAYVPPEGHVTPVLGRDVPDGWEGRLIVGGDHWLLADNCRESFPDALFEVRRVPAPEPATEWVPLTKLVGRTLDGCDKPCDGHPTYDDVFDNWMWRNGPSWMIIPRNKLNLDTAQVLVLAEGER